MNNACKQHKGTYREQGSFKITLAGYTKETDSPKFVVSKKVEGKQKFKVFFIEQDWFCTETKTGEVIKIIETDEGIPDMDQFFQTDFLNPLIEELFDIVDQEMISNLKYSLGPRSYKIYQGIEDPPVECINQVAEILTKPDLSEMAWNHWKKWLKMCLDTCVENGYIRSHEVGRDHIQDKPK